MKSFKIIENLKSTAGKLKKETLTLYFAYKNPQLTILPKLIIIFTVAYALSPIDLIPDFIPVLGYLDDLIILPLLISLSVKLIPSEIMDKSRELADKTSIPLKKNWIIAAAFILIWAAILGVIVSVVLKNFNLEK